MPQFAGYVYSKAITVPAGETISVTNNGGGPTAVSLTAGTYSIFTLAAMLQTVLTAQRPGSGGGVWAVSVSTTTGQVTISMSVGTFSITWTSTNLRSVLGFTGNIVAAASSTGAAQAKGIWFPDCVLVSDVDIRRALQDTHRRATVAPTGRTSSARGPGAYEHSGLSWGHVTSNRVWTAEEATGVTPTLVNAAYETFVKDALLNQGHAWFPYDGRVAIVDHRGYTAGADLPISSWCVAVLPELVSLRMVIPGYVPLIAVTWPLITSDG